jgi:murein DD-endopeptidase MepM/ murein hydrolase activator NlpD
VDLRAAEGKPFYMPENTPVLALRSGIVISASVADGVTVDHRNGFCTTYRGLFETLVDARREIYGGDVIGTIRLPSSAPCGLRFELWRNQPWRAELVREIPGFCRGINPLNALLGTVAFPIEGLRQPLRKEAA